MIHPRLAFLVVHGVALVGSLLIGRALTGWVLRRLRLVNDDLDQRGTKGAGATIGMAERFLTYLTVAGGQTGLLAALVALKTVVRYPEVRLAAERKKTARQAGEGVVDDGGRFAEYYLVGTLVSLCVGVSFPLAAMGILHLL